jgi:hypothetical protein
MSVSQAEQRKKLVIRAVRALAGVCDGARAKDGLGYNSMDWLEGHHLAGIRPDSRWTEKDVEQGLGLVWKYQRQLREQHGIELLDLPKPEVTVEKVNIEAL